MSNYACMYLCIIMKKHRVVATRRAHCRKAAPWYPRRWWWGGCQPGGWRACECKHWSTSTRPNTHKKNSIKIIKKYINLCFPMWVHDTHLLSLCDPMTFTYSQSVWDNLVSRNWTHSWKTSGDLIWQPNTFQVFSRAGFSSVLLCRYVERVRGVVDTSNATMVNSP